MLLRRSTKYKQVIKTTVKEATAYRFDALSAALFSFLKILLAYILWKAIFGSKDVIAGYTFPMMLTYYIFMAFMTKMAKSVEIVWETSSEVREGTFTKYVTRPLNHFLYSLSRTLGKVVFAGTVDLIAFAIWSVIFRQYFYIQADIAVLALVVLFFVLGLFTQLQIYYLISLISFKTIEIAGPFFLITNVVSFASGQFIPLSLLPIWIESALSFTPFYYIVYYPINLYLGIAETSPLRALIIIFIWNLIFMVFRQFYYKRMLKLYEGVGV